LEEALQLEKYQADLVPFRFERLAMGDDVDSLEFSLRGEFPGKYKVVNSVLSEDSDSSRVVITLPTYSRSVFLALTQKNQIETSRILANLEDYERESKVELGLGETIRLPEPSDAASQMPYAVLLLRTATAPSLAAVPDRRTIDDISTNFFLAVPLTGDEWKVRNERGHDALMDLFEERGKDLFF